MRQHPCHHLSHSALSAKTKASDGQKHQRTAPHPRAVACSPLTPPEQPWFGTRPPRWSSVLLPALRRGPGQRQAKGVWCACVGHEQPTPANQRARKPTYSSVPSFHLAALAGRRRANMRFPRHHLAMTLTGRHEEGTSVPGKRGPQQHSMRRPGPSHLSEPRSDRRGASLRLRLVRLRRGLRCRQALYTLFSPSPPRGRPSSALRARPPSPQQVGALRLAGPDGCLFIRDLHSREPRNRPSSGRMDPCCCFSLLLSYRTHTPTHPRPDLADARSSTRSGRYPSKSSSSSADLGEAKFPKVGEPCLSVCLSSTGRHPSPPLPSLYPPWPSMHHGSSSSASDGFPIEAGPSVRLHGSARAGAPRMSYQQPASLARLPSPPGRRPHPPLHCHRHEPCAGSLCRLLPPSPC